MIFRHYNLDESEKADGLAVVIDVIRAFTSAPFALAAGAGKILLVRNIDEAFRLKRKIPGALIMGEDRGLPPKGFDFGNSPADLEGLDLSGKTMIQRTSAGTQGVTRAVNAEHKIAASFVCARATIDYIRKIGPEKVSFIITGSESGFSGSEDAACADYLEASLKDKNPDPAEYLEKVRTSPVSREIFLNPDFPLFKPEDIDKCTCLDLFSFPLVIEESELGAVIYNYN